MREIWLMQPRFERRTVSSAQSLVQQARFRAGYDFLRLRADCGELDTELADWWEDFHLGNDEDREAMLADLRAQTPARGAASARGKRPAAEGQDAGPALGDEAEAAADEGGASAPRKRRRRRRKPAAREGAAPASE
jgi:poly(A) polymerase